MIDISKINVEEIGIAEIGEEVVYTGDLSHAMDVATEDLMVKHLTCGSVYKVVSMHKYFDIVWHYIFEGIPYCCFPYKSFTKRSNRSIMSDLYGLR